MWELLLKLVVPLKFSLVAAVGALAPLIILFLLERREKTRREQAESPPQEEKLLRPPGHSLASKMEKLWDDLIDQLPQVLAFGAFGAILFYEGFVFLAYPELRLAGTFSLIAAVACGFLAGRRTVAIRNLMRLRRNCQLGLRGEQAVAESLTEIASFGYRAFHDLPGEGKWNIDHVVVGPSGVFAIETKARRRRVGAGKQPAHEVHYDAEKLYFPTGEDREAVPQARGNARWVAEYLTKETGERVNAMPLLVLPGWYVKRLVADTKGFMAMNTTYLKKYLADQPEKLPPAQVRRIITALEKKCRDVEF